MKVLYDHQIFSLQKYGGISRYFVELIKGLDSIPDVETKIHILLSSNHYITNSDFVPFFKFFPNRRFKGKSYIQSLINNYYTIPKIKNAEFDLFHPTYFDPYFIKSIGNKPFVLTVYDMIHERYKEMFPAHEKTSPQKRFLAEKASRIISISENTKKDLIELYGIHPGKIDVVYLGNSLSPSGDMANGVKLPERYILFVGSRARYKNFGKLIHAVTPILHKDKSLCVVCAGGNNFKDSEIQLFKQLDIPKQIFQYNIDDSHLAQFYKNALVFAFPSLYEGFGIPVLESFACGCPLACSNTSSLPEIAGGAAAYFDPDSEESIFSTINRVVNNIEIRSDLVKRGKERLPFFSWEKTAIETKKVYENCINNRG